MGSEKIREMSLPCKNGAGHGKTHGIMVLCREAADLLGPPRAAGALLGGLGVLERGLGLTLAEGEVEVGEDDVPRVVQQNVFRLQVPVNEAHQVEVLQRNQHLREGRRRQSGVCGMIWGDMWGNFNNLGWELASGFCRSVDATW